MAELRINPAYRPFVNELKEILSRNQVSLTQHSEELLELATEAWFEELEPNWPKDPTVLQNLARDIVQQATKDQHIIDARNKGPVPFDSFMVALAEAGRRIMRPFHGKGF
jgi:hypothetical protein